MVKNQLKQKLNNGQTVLGSWNITGSAAVVEAMGHSGLDFVVIDAEHGPLTIESVENLIRAAECSAMVPIVRVPKNESSFILKALDLGAGGVQIPHVCSKKDAQLAVSYCKYFPLGSRGYTPFTRAAKYGLQAERHTQSSNAQTLTIINVEGVEGIKNLEQIITVPDVDVVFIGPYDLSHSLGQPGEVTHPKVIASIKSCAKMLKHRRIACGSFAKDLKYIEILIDCGVQYITYLVDATMVLQAYSAFKQSVQKIIAKRQLNK